jgi:hypothetical protein
MGFIICTTRPPHPPSARGRAKASVPAGAFFLSVHPQLVFAGGQATADLFLVVIRINLERAFLVEFIEALEDDVGAPKTCPIAFGRGRSPSR